MNQSEQEMLIDAITATAEILGHEIKPGALVVMAGDLADMPLEAVLAALTRCRRELTGRLTLAALIERIQAHDGRLSANEAWALAIKSMDESQTVVLNDDIAAALNFSRDIFNSGDEIGARMAFRDSYERIVRDAREQGRPLKWWPSLGHDVAGREPVIQQAVVAGLLPGGHLQSLPAPSGGFVALLENADKNVSGDNEGEYEIVSPDVARDRVASMMALFGKKHHVPLTKEQVEQRRAELLETAERLMGEGK